MIEKILSELRELPHGKYTDDYGKGFSAGINAAISIVQEVAKEYSRNTSVRSNADRIRSFSDEELAEFLKKFDLCTNCKYGEDVRCTFGNPCTHGFATAMAYEWLKSEVKE